MVLDTEMTLDTEMVLDTEKITRLLRTEPSCVKPLPSLPGRELSSILKKADGLRGLLLEDSARLLAVSDPEQLHRIFEKAREIKLRVFGNRIVLFAPLYLSNQCVNGCLYCGFRAGNRSLERKTLTQAEVVREARALERMGFKRVLLVTAEIGSTKAGGTKPWGTQNNDGPQAGGTKQGGGSTEDLVQYISRCVRAIYKETGIRIVHLNAPAMEVGALRELKKTGIGLYQLFQETYHRATYERMHPFGPKKDFNYRLLAMDRAIDAGFSDVGIGPLLGLHDYHFEVLSTIAHSHYLHDRYGTHAHTVSVPRLRPAPGANTNLAGTDTGAGLGEPPSPVSDSEFRKIVAVYRLSLPTTGVVVSTRESAELRDSLISSGASQLSAASSTAPGGYADNNNGNNNGNGNGTARDGAGKRDGRFSTRFSTQFSTNDTRPLVEVMASIVSKGGIPSLCTTCYRTGRTGADFGALTQSGSMKKFCEANSLLTLKEFMLEHPLNGLADVFSAALEGALLELPDNTLRREVEKKLKELEEGQRDLYF